MREDLEQRACELAQYMIENRTTVRAAAKRFGISKSTVHKDLTERPPSRQCSTSSRRRATSGAAWPQSGNTSIFRRPEPGKAGQNAAARASPVTGRAPAPFQPSSRVSKQQ